MSLYIFTIRDKRNKKIIHAESIQDFHCRPDFNLEPQYLTDKDLDILSFYKYNGNYCYDEEIRYLLNYKFEKVIFSVEEYVFDSECTLKKKW